MADRPSGDIRRGQTEWRAILSAFADSSLNQKAFCRLQGINPYTYLADVLQRITEHPASDVVALTPRLWQQRFADGPLTSDLQCHGA